MTTINPGGHAGGSDVKYNIENRLNQVTHTNTKTKTNTTGLIKKQKFMHDMIYVLHIM